MLSVENLDVFYGDAQALEAHDRRVVHVHLARGVDPAPALERLFTEALA